MVYGNIIAPIQDQGNSVYKGIILRLLATIMKLPFERQLQQKVGILVEI